MGGLLTALKLAKQERFEACVVTPVDTPFLGAADLTLLIETWQQNPAAPVCGRRETDGQRQPLIAVYPIVCYELIRDAAESNQRSLLKWLGDHDHLAVDLPARSCHNINTPHDLNAALPFFDDPDPRRIHDPPNS